MRNEGIVIKTITRAYALSNKLTEQLQGILQQVIRQPTEEKIMAGIAKGKILPILEHQPNPTVIGIGLEKAIDHDNEWGLFDLLFKPELDLEKIKIALKAFENYAYKSLRLTKISIILADSNNVSEILKNSGFTEKQILQSHFKTPGAGYIDGYLLSAASDNRPIKPLIESAPDNQLSELQTLRDEIKSREEMINNLKETIGELEQQNTNLAEQIKQLKAELDQKEQQIKERELSNVQVLKVEGDQQKTKELQQGKKDIAATHPLFNEEELESLMIQFGLKTGQRKVLKVVIQHPDITIKGIQKLTKILPSNISIICTELSYLGLIEKTSDPSDKRIKIISPVEGIIDKMREKVAKEEPIIQIPESGSDTIAEIVKRKLKEFSKPVHPNIAKGLIHALISIQKNTAGITKEELKKELKCYDPTVRAIVSLLQEMELITLGTDKRNGTEYTVIKPVQRDNIPKIEKPKQFISPEVIVTRDSETDKSEKKKLSINELCAKHGLCQDQIEILQALKEKGGSLSRETLKTTIGINGHRLNDCLLDLKKYGLVKEEGGAIILTI